MISLGGNAAERPTAALREDLRLTPTAAGANGEPAWVIQDAVVNRFYRIGWFEFECLLRWGQSPRSICEQIADETALKPDVDQVLGFSEFLRQHHLVHPDAEGLTQLRQRSEGGRWTKWRWWLHHYLFFRIPLLRPQGFLRTLAGMLSWLFTPWAAATVIGLGLLGVMLVLRQWDHFSTSVVESFSAEGLLSFALALIVAKTLHELGHAIVATRLGLRVGHMGVAFVVLWPMLYTDTGESWKLRSSRQRLAIASAGIATELALAGLATLGWALMDDGPVRSALLYLATTSWVLSVALNASPFMRFDGYFILSDLLDFPNLHERASALARVAMRRTLLGLPEPWPEAQPPKRRRALIAFAYVTWVYRALLFAGIAVAVYLMFFKVLGIFLFAVEIAWFIVLPVWREAKHWWSARERVPTRHRRMLWLLLGGFILLLAVPWRTQVGAVGLARAEHQAKVFAPFPSLLTELREGGSVQAGDTLAVLAEPDIAARMQSSQAGLRGYEARLAGLMADPAGLAEQAALRERLIVQVQEVRAARAEMARLTLKAPFAGVWRDVDPEWRAGQWVGTHEHLGVLVDPRSWQVDAYVKPDDVHRLAVGNKVRFYAEGQPHALTGSVRVIASARVNQLEHPALAQRFGGPLPTAANAQALTPTPAVFHVLVQLDAPPPGLHETRGRLQIDGSRRSLLGDGFTWLAAVLMRESGF